MNNIEEALLNAAANAQKRYKTMSGGWWLGHAPEHFLTSYVAEAVAKDNWTVYLEVSPKKVLEDHQSTGRGRPPKDLKIRFDMVIWRKSSDKLNAIVEVKRAWDISLLRADATKVRNQRDKRYKPAHGYLLVYTTADKKLNRKEASPLEKVERRIESWREDLKAVWIETKTGTERSKEEESAWAVALIKLY